MSVQLAAAVAAMSMIAGQAGAPGADALAFMAGCWRLERGGRVIEEQWMAPAGGTLLGMSRTVEDGRTLEFEHLRIVTTPDGLQYVARPSGQAEAAFTAVRVSAAEAVFENPTHDFPQRIAYTQPAEGQLHARVEGLGRGVTFEYARVACPQ
ncbi:MAG: DUF6265 family protein [Vicinamibacterales bacterium]